MDCSAVDMVNIVNFTQRMVKLAEFRKQLVSYMTDKMAIVAPNLSTLIGDTVAARLISKAGSLTSHAKAPASTVQILGAEKALFRALKTKGNTPKYGLIYHSTFIGRADSKNRGRISRYLANKCSIATRIDSFSDEPTNAYGVKLRDQIEERLQFYETGAKPRKNIDVMEEVAKSLAVASSATDESKKKKKRKLDEDEPKSDKKKKKKKDTKDVDVVEKEESDKDDMEVEKEEQQPKSDKKKKKAKKAKKESLEAPSTPVKEEEEEVKTPKSKKSDKKKKKKKSN